MAVTDKYVTVDFLSKNLGSEMFDILSNQAINAGANFLSGKTTSAFQSAANSKIGQETVELASNLAATASIVAMSPDIVKNLTQSIFTMTTNLVATESARILTEGVTKITAKAVAVPKDIVSYSTSYFNKHKKKIGDLVAELSKTSEDRVEEFNKKAEEAIKNAAKEKMDKIKGNIEKGISAVNDTIGPVINMVSTYLQNGPDWIADKINKEVTGVLSYCENFVDSNVSKICDEMDKFSYNQGNTIGEKMTEKYNQTLAVQAAKQLAKVKELLAQAKALLHKVKQAAILKIMALTGIPIPI